MTEPTHVTSSGTPVHARSHDHLPDGTRYQRFNKRVAVWITKNAGSMTFFWLCWLVCLTILPSCLAAANYIHGNAFYLTFGFELLMTWFASTVLELVLMPAIMVGQNIQSAAADARAEKSFEDIEYVKDQVNEHTDGGIKSILDAVAEVRKTVDFYVAAGTEPKSGKRKAAK